MAKKNNAIVWSIIIGVILLIGIIAVFNVHKSPLLSSSVSSGSYINVPTFMWYKCEEAPSNYPPIDNLYNIDSTGKVTVSCPANVEKCDITVIGEPNTWLGRRVIYQICNKNTNVCYAEETLPVSEVNFIPWGRDYNRPAKVIKTNLGVNELVKITYQKSYVVYWGNVGGATIEVKGQPFIITKNSIFTGVGMPFTTVEQGCTIPTDSRNNLLNSFSNLVGWNANTQSTTSTSTLAFRETRNFIDNLVPISQENVKFVDNGNAYCMNDKVYAVGSVTTNSGTYKVVDMSGTFASILRSVTCCPGDVNPAGTQKCNSNFQWEDINGGECSAFNPCSPDESHAIPSGVPKQLMWYTCEKGFCVKKTATKECVSDQDCIGSPKGNYCDRKTWKCSLVPVPVCPTTCAKDTDCAPCGDYICSPQSKTCISKGVDGNWFTNLLKSIGGFFSDLFSGLFGWLVTVKYIIIGITSLITLFISAGQLEKIRELRKNKKLRWIIAFIIAGAVGWILYLFIGSFLFWLLFIGIIVLIGVLVAFFPAQAGAFVGGVARRR